MGLRNQNKYFNINQLVKLLVYTRLYSVHIMLDQIARKRTSFEISAWEQVRELMPRRQGTRGIQYEALEYLFEHLYEKISEEQLKDHFLQVKGHLQQKGDPVKSAINLAVKELQRLSEPTFELIKIQEASLVGKMRRYVQLNYTAFDSVIKYEDFESYVNDILSGEEIPVLRSVFNHHPAIEPTIFPGIKQEWLKKSTLFPWSVLLNRFIRKTTKPGIFLSLKVSATRVSYCYMRMKIARYHFLDLFPICPRSRR